MQTVAAPTQTFRPTRPVLVRALNWLIAADAAYREAHHLASSPRHRLDDIGVARSEANARFFRRFGDRDLAHHVSFGW